MRTPPMSNPPGTVASGFTSGAPRSGRSTSKTSPGSVRMPSPLIGEHGPEILEELGYTPEQIQEFLEAGVISVEALSEA